MNHKSKFFELSVDQQLGLRRFMGIISIAYAIKFISYLLLEETKISPVLILFGILFNIVYFYFVINIEKAPNWIFSLIVISAYFIILFDLSDVFWGLFIVKRNYLSVALSMIPVIALTVYFRDILSYRSLTKKRNL